MKTKCLVCGELSEATALLCSHCGAPLPESAPASVVPHHPRHRQAFSRLARVAAAGIAAVIIVVVAVTLTSKNSLTPNSTLETMPNGMNSISAWNLSQLWKYEKLQPLWGNPIVKQYFGTAKSMAGIDVEALDSFVAGSRLTDQQFEVLYVVKGAFDATTLNGIIGTFCTSEIVVAQRRLKSCDLNSLVTQSTLPTSDDENGGKAGDEKVPEASITAIPEITAPISLGIVAVGVWDATTFVAGTPDMLEAYFTGGDAVGGNETLELLMKDADPTAFGWGGLQLNTVYTQLCDAFPMLVSFPKLENGTLQFEMQLREVLGLRLILEVADVQTIKMMEPVIRIGLASAIKTANESLALTGQTDLLAAEIEVNETRFEVQFTLKIPALPSI